jgi:citrate lyase subunit beta / citryl-CoA lyase
MVSLVVPASSERMLAKARSIEAQEIVIDLEDAVVAERKRDALAAALAALQGGGFAATSVAVRVNAPRTPWAHEELIALAGAPAVLSSLVIPKVQDAGDLGFVERLLDGAESAAGGRGQRLGVQALIETARGMRSLDEIVRASDRLEAVVLGYVDLAASLQRSPQGASALDMWLGVQDAVLSAARAVGVRAIDGPHVAIGDEDGLFAAAKRAAELGFDGKWAIHPAQLPVITRAFTPSTAEVEHARSVLEALAAASDRGDGAVAFDGEMLDEPVRLAALRTLERAEHAARITEAGE